MFLYWKNDHFAYYLVRKVDLQSIFTSEMSKKSIFKLYKVFFFHISVRENQRYVHVFIHHVEKYLLHHDS